MSALEPAHPPLRRWKKTARHAGGFFLLLTGIPLVLLPLPTPGVPAVFFGLRLLRDDYPWARRLLGQIPGYSAQVRSRLSHVRLKQAQETLRRHLFGGRLWWKKSALQQNVAPPPVLPDARGQEAQPSKQGAASDK